MKVTYPLSLKLTLWLLLNLVLLVALGLGLLAAQGGISWDALVSGRAGETAQRTAEALARELTETPADERDALIARFNAAQRVEFIPFLNGDGGRQIAGTPVDLPPIARERVAARPGPGAPGGPRGGPGGKKGPPKGDGNGGFGPPEKGPRDPAIARPDPRDPRDPARDRGRGRFLLKTDAPSAYWIGVRTPFQRYTTAPTEPATVFIRVTSVWAMLSLLDMQPWLLAAGAVLVFSILFWLPIVHGITSDLRRLTAATGQIAEGKFDTRVSSARRDELGHLSQSVNLMAARLDTLVNGQKRFLGDIAHELGSPLGRLQVATEILETRAAPALRDQVADVREEVQQMATLVNELLAFTKAGLRPREAELATIELDAVIADVLAREDPASRVRTALEPGLRVRADRQLLSRALGNLVRNALRYAGDAAAITVSTRSAGPHNVLSVEDDGPGVPPEALARLGEPFYRPESARTRETGGVGLGLAIVRSSAAACGGEVSFSNRTPHGFRADLKLADA